MGYTIKQMCSGLHKVREVLDETEDVMLTESDASLALLCAPEMPSADTRSLASDKVTSVWRNQNGLSTRERCLLKAQILKLFEIADREQKVVVILPKGFEWKLPFSPYPAVPDTPWEKKIAYEEAQQALIKDIRENQMIEVEVVG